MRRREFLRNTFFSVPLVITGSDPVYFNEMFFSDMESKIIKPRAITMWDFSWLERRWPGAGYEDWDKALDELLERGYNAVRIDAYPHLVAENPEKEYTLEPVWSVQMWGSPGVIKVQVQPSLNEFISKCRDRNIKVGLSSWYRQDRELMLMKIVSPEKMAENWIKTLETIKSANLIDNILYVDLCNEWPGDIWCPYFKNDPPEKTWGYWHTEKSMAFMKESVELVRKSFPEIPVCYSFTGGEPALYAQKDLSFFDLLEHHTWMAQLNGGEYDKAVGYSYDRFNYDSYNRLAANYERVYFERRDYWQKQLIAEILLVSKSAKTAGLPLITTECWGIVDFIDWPGLKWDIIKELGEIGVQTAALTGQWLAIATSNFAGPQFVGMWRDAKWHQKLTNIIRNAEIAPGLYNSKLAGRLI
jgi:hypothetical protein